MRDAVVVGAGPAGSVTATLLARAGWDVLLLDRAHFPRHKACAEYLSPGVLQALERLHLWDAIAAGGPHRFHGMEIVSPRGARLRVQYQTNGHRREAATLPRSDLDSILVEEAKRAGASFTSGVTVHSAITDGSHVTGLVAHGPTGPEPVPARITIIADGARSAVARRLGLTEAPRWPVRLGLMSYWVGTGHLPDGFGQMEVGFDGYCGIAPLPNDRLNVAIVLPHDAARRSGLSSEALFRAWIHSHIRTSDVLRDCELSTRVRGFLPVGSRCRRPWLPGALVVGDAAGFFDPFTGEGIYRAVVGAELASQVADNALRKGDVSSASLQPYESLRRSAFRWKSVVTAMIQCFVQYPALMEYALPRLANRPEPADRLTATLGDLVDARSFLRPRVLWAGLRP